MRILFVLAAALCAAGPLRAQQASGGVDFFQSSLAEILDTPLLAASYAPERPSDAAATAYVVTAETIGKRGYATLLDLLEDMPQFQAQRESDVRRLNLVSVRGIPGNERLVILYDGARITPPTGDLFAIAGQLSLTNAERVEVVLGPMSSLYGADAFSGVVNVVTRSGGVSGAAMGFGSYSATAAGFSVKSRLSGAASGPAASVTYDSRYSAGPRLPSYYKKDYAWFNGQYQAGLAQLSPFNSAVTAVPVAKYDAHEDSSFLDGRLHLGDLEVGLVMMRESHSSSIGVKPELTLYDSDARFATASRTLYGRHLYSSPDDSWRLTTTLSYYDYEIPPETRFVNSFSGYASAYKYASSKTTTFEETLSFDAAENLPVLLGFTYQENAVLPYTSDLDHKFDAAKSPLSQDFFYLSTSGVTNIPVDFYSLRYSNTGTFAKVQKDFEDLSLSAGLRYDRNTRYGETWNPRAGLVWRPGGSETTVAKVLYGEAYLAPSPFWANKHFGAFVSSPTAASGYHSYFFHIPNEGLKPEKLRSVEGTFTQGLGHALRLTVNPYYNIVRDLIQDVTIGPGFFKGVEVDALEQARNQGTMETYGATLRVDASLRAGRWNFEPWTACTLSEGRLGSGPLPFNSRRVVQAGVSAARGRWVFTPNLLYRSYTRNQDGGRVPQFTVANLFARYSDSASSAAGFAAWVRLKNILDRRYYNAAYGGGSDHLDGAPQTPFSAEAGVEYRF